MPTDLSAPSRFEPDREFHLYPRQVESGGGTRWFAQGWEMFLRAPRVWVGLIAVAVLIAVALNLVPLVGGVLFNLAMPVFMGGLMLGCKAVEERKPLEINHLFAGFSHGTSALVVIGVVTMVATVVITIVVFGLIGVSALPALIDGGPLAVKPIGIAAVVGVFAAMICVALLGMATWFAPALVIDRGIAPIDAMKASFSACTSNIGSMFVFGLLIAALAIAASLPLMLGWLVLGPLLVTATWAAYRDLFYSA